MDELNILEYAEEKGLDNIYADLCKNKKEIDAVLWCLFIIDDRKYLYDHAVALRPHDPKGRQEALAELLVNKNKRQHDDILIEWEGCYHWKSMAQIAKDDIFDECYTIMHDAGMGKKKWLKLKPLLTKFLNHTPSTDERNFTEEFAQLQTQRRLEILLKSI